MPPNVLLLATAALVSALVLATPSSAQGTSGLGSTAKTALAPAEVLQRLRAGGYTVHFRHARTDESQADEPAATASEACADRGECGDCSKQRNLSASGRDQARKIGAAIRALNIPIDTVLAGPLCRTLETAQLIFGRAESSPDVRGGGLGRPSYPGLIRLLSTRVPAGSNQVLLGHGGQFEAVAGAANHLDPGDAAVIKGMGNGKFEIIALVRSADWSSLLSMAAEGPK